MRFRPLQPLQLCILLFALPAALPAQDVPRAPRRRAAVGAEVGYSRTTLGGPDAQGLRSRQGAITGLFLQAPLGGPFSLRPELLFALKGGGAQATVEGGGTALLDIELAYLELPLLLRVGVPRGRFRPMLFGGPAGALQIGCDLQLIGSDQPFRSTCDAADFAAFRQFDFALVVGAGIEMRWPQSSLSLEGRYTSGLRSVLEDFDVRNRGYGVVLALTF
jgi:hypothetical protein